MRALTRLASSLCCIQLMLVRGITGRVPVTIKRDGFVIDSFQGGPFNDLDAWHGAGEELPVEYAEEGGYVRLFPTNPDHNYHTQVSSSCLDMTGYAGMYLHVVFSGPDKFSISLNQHNEDCNPDRAPYPDTSDSVEASRYSLDDDIYVPLSHFSIDMSRVMSVSFHGFYTKDEVTLYKVEIVPSIPAGFTVPEKLETGSLILKCKRPNSFAFGIDDGDPQLAQEVMHILEEEDILVTFFVVGNGLEAPDTNLTEVYREMIHRGHQVALHTYTHPKMEGLQTVEQIDYEILEGFRAIKDLLGVESRYFRPPYGTIGARTRQRLAHLLDDPYIVNWSVDIEDWLYADSDTPEKQLEAFQRDVDRGGDIVVMHYLSRSTVQYFREVIRIARETGKRIMRVDQCMLDPEAPPLEDKSWD
ncbi:Polysaccharide deacetylase [Rasamsonia emersonii CBS 393.64]|uniref:Polysaccharide deacetylase n=1 Tax=Rasamsonia emersonii (strain ATCC 16479 / CBS 393.64 / IMI 116815) TaxID=1408163 RepID=A0A0F4YXH0_RASE3|nr:Polysaccharide deacetylase [Rasamsonia emersonii CBS 393.64]KKA22934.1 Polysaccharide deacetylase [Rasamsonia emersonii CBS 393.64]